MDWLTQHPYTIVIATWVFNTIVTAFVGAFPAPTANSSTFYQWWFVFSNTVIGNIKRAQSTHVENSPNWEDAFQKKLNGHAATLTDEQKSQILPPEPQKPV